jgi:transposase
MRKGFDGLSGLVQSKMGSNPTDGSVYIFINRRRDRMKMLVWEPGGFMMYYKRLEQGTFDLPQKSGESGKIQISWEILAMLISGIKTVKIIRKKRYGYAV